MRSPSLARINHAAAESQALTVLGLRFHLLFAIYEETTNPSGPLDAMHSQNPFLDEFAKLTQTAMGLAQTAGEEAKTAFRAQADRIAAELDLVRRDDFEALKAELAALREEVAGLKAKKAAAPKAGKSAE